MEGLRSLETGCQFLQLRTSGACVLCSPARGGAPALKRGINLGESLPGVLKHSFPRMNAGAPTPLRKDRWQFLLLSLE